MTRLFFSFIKKEMGLLFGIALALAFLLIPLEYANSAVLKMPKPLPNIIKSYKSVYVHAGRPGMSNSGVQVMQGDYITILAKGTIDVSPWARGVYIYGPKDLLKYKLSEKDSERQYEGPELIEIRESGNIYLSYEYRSSIVPSRPDYHLGSFYVDIIVWKTKDPNLVAKFLEEASLRQPEDNDLKEMVQEFKRRQEVLAGVQDKTKEPVGKLPDSTSPVIKMPKPSPHIIKSYKSVKVVAGVPGMKDTGVEVEREEPITILAKGMIDTWPTATNIGGMSVSLRTIEQIYPEGYTLGPKKLLLFRIGERGPAEHYKGPDIIEAYTGGKIYLGYRGSEVDAYGESLRPRYFDDDSGSYEVDIIVWKKNDPVFVGKFLEETSKAQPKDKELKEIVQEFRKRQEILVGLQKKTKEIEEIRKQLSAVETKDISEIKKEEKKVEESKLVIPPPVKEPISEVKKPEKEKPIPEQKVAKKVEGKPVPPKVAKAVQRPQEEKKIVTPSKEKEIPEIKEEEKEKRLQELGEKLKRALQAVKELEEMKEVLARLESMEVEKAKQPKNLPVIAIGYPQDGMNADSEIVSLYGVAEYEKGIQKVEILVNNRPIAFRGQKDLQIPSKDRKRIEFSEKIRLQEGQNTIAVVVQGTEGLTNQKKISILLAKKREVVYGVVIGINKYKNFPSLKYAANDAREFYRYLTEVNRVPKENVWLFLDEEATLEKLRTTLGTLLRRSAGKDDTVIIFLAGHGATEQDASSPDGDGLEKYILPHNADPKDLYGSAIPMSEIARIFQRISSDRLVFIGDTCYSGGSGGRTILVAGKRSNVSGAFLERVTQGKGRVIITASDANEVSVEKDELKHGVFTYYLLEGLRGKADFDKDGVVTVDEVYRYVSIKVPQATGQDQHPVKKGEVTGEIVLGVVK
jgi:hypothetical protein